MLTLLGAGLAVAGATAGAIGSSANRRRAQDEESASYRQAKDYLNTMYYRDPLTTVGNRSLLKAAERNYEDNLEAINNRMIAGGATMENQLAARQANNESRDKLYGQLLMGEDARRDRLGMQKLSLDQQHSANVQGNYMQAAQDWQSWGAAMGQAGLSVMSSGLLGGSEVSDAGKYSGAMDNYRTALDNLQKVQPITSSAAQGLKTPLVTGPKSGLAGR